MRESVAWQKKYDRRAGLAVDLFSSLMMPQSSIVLPLPGSPLIHKSGLCLALRHC